MLRTRAPHSQEHASCRRRLCESLQCTLAGEVLRRGRAEVLGGRAEGRRYERADPNPGVERDWITPAPGRLVSA